ncbi:hypothetical protein EVAR_75405_1 [Eumeta japonica]|uniref:Uncharacterized protein n=1 Tax=Eumeta variegata TaxID=151549 RepID=A0A4C1TJZ5_EUMVA|nr:hypothetical protein EVAR_75405_1 [Eumeta japonica]
MSPMWGPSESYIAFNDRDVNKVVCARVRLTSPKGTFVSLVAQKLINDNRGQVVVTTPPCCDCKRGRDRVAGRTACCDAVSTRHLI